MNLTILTFFNGTNTTSLEPWFIPLDILMILCPIVGILVAIVCLFILMTDKTCHTIHMLLVANTYVAEILLASDILWMSVFTYSNDLHQNQKQDSLCSFRGYLSYSTLALQNYSYLLQAFYRYVIVLYPTHLYWRSIRIQIGFISLIWIFGFLFPLPFYINKEIIYHIDSQICQIAFRLSFSIIFIASCVYIIPVCLIILIYFKLVSYTRMKSGRVVPVNTLARAKRELKMVRRIIVIVSILVVLGIPYVTFLLMSFFTTPPRYYLRIAVPFITISVTLIVIILYHITDPLKESILKLIRKRTNVVASAIA